MEIAFNPQLRLRNLCTVIVFREAHVHGFSGKLTEQKVVEAFENPISQAEHELAGYLTQFSQGTRENAHRMASWYVLFHMLENDVRQFVCETLHTKGADTWWDDCVPEHVRKGVESNRQRELDFGFQIRSEEPLDYATFGQLSEIMRANWDVFGGVLSTQKAGGRVLATLKTLRGPIAHCGVLAPDEVDRLKLSVKDWFRVLEGPQ
ncbi:MAG: Swt1 family HEPN domain-containing protein [Caulobacteraceae bacterium]